MTTRFMAYILLMFLSLSCSDQDQGESEGLSQDTEVSAIEISQLEQPTSAVCFQPGADLSISFQISADLLAVDSGDDLVGVPRMDGGEETAEVLRREVELSGGELVLTGNPIPPGVTLIIPSSVGSVTELFSDEDILREGLGLPIATSNPDVSLVELPELDGRSGFTASFLIPEIGTQMSLTLDGPEAEVNRLLGPVLSSLVTAEAVDQCD